MEITARFSHEKIDHTKNNTPHLVVELKAPTLDWVTKRPALCVLPLVDLSGSMDDKIPGSPGSKLDYAKKSLHKLVDQLQPGDVSGLIGFESKTHILIPAQAVTAELKTKLHTAIDRLKTMGGTNMCDGLLESLKAIEKLDLGPKYIKRVIMFTDGEPTSGVTDKTQILKLMGEKLGSATVSAFGYGSVGHTSFANIAGIHGCDPEFMTQISQAGKGNYAYVQNPDDALTAFGREFGGLISTYAQDIKVSVDPQSGHQITKVVTDLKTETDPLGKVFFDIPEILAEETRHFVFDTSLSSQHKAFPRQFNIFNIKVSYSVLTEKGERETKTLEAKAKIRFVETGEEDKDIAADLNEVIALAQVVRAQLEAEDKAKAGDWAGASVIMNNTSKNLRSRGLPNTAKLAESVGTRVASAAAYADGSSYLRSVSAAGTRSYGIASMDGAAACDLAFMAGSMTNSSMTAYETSFRVPNPAEVVPSVWNPQLSPQVNLSNLLVQAATPDVKPEDPAPRWVDPKMAVSSGDTEDKT